MDPIKTTSTSEDTDVKTDDVTPEKYVLTGAEFKKLIKNAKNLGAESLDYSSRKNNKYMVKLPGGKKVHLDHLNMKIILFIKIKSEEINIFLELQRLKIKRVS